MDQVSILHAETALMGDGVRKGNRDCNVIACCIGLTAKYLYCMHATQHAASTSHTLSDYSSDHSHSHVLLIFIPRAGVLVLCWG